MRLVVEPAVGRVGVPPVIGRLAEVPSPSGVPTGVVPTWQREWALTGREEELALLEAMLADPMPRGAVLFGRAGTGKSRLAREVASRAERAGGVVFRAQGTASAGRVPFGALAHLVAPPAQRLPERASTFEAIATDLQRRGHGPPLIILDDAHRLDEASAALALHLVLTQSVALLACVRDGEPAPDAVTALWKDDHLARVDLQVLSEGQVAAMVRGALRGAVAPEVVQWVQERSLGFPLFVVELIRGAASEGVLRLADGAWTFTSEPSAPQRIRDLIGQRLVNLTEEERAGLGLVALGEPLEYRLARDVIGEPPLAALESAGFVEVEPAASAEDRRRVIRPAHPLYGEAAVMSMSRVQRDAAGRRLADAVAATGQRRAADLLRTTRWRLEASEAVSVPALLRTAAAAQAIFDPVLAVQYARRAHDADPTAATALALAGPLMSLARFAEVEALLAPFAGQEADEHEAATVVGLRTLALQVGMRRTPEALALLEQADGVHASASWRRRMRDHRINVTNHAGQLREAARLLRELLDDPATTQADLRRSWAGPFALLFSGDAAAARRFATSLIGEHDTPGPDAVEVLAWAAARLDAGSDWDRIDGVLAPLLADADRSGDRALAVVCGLVLGNLALERGRLRSAEAYLTRAERLAQTQDPFAVRILLLALLAQARALRRDVEGARQALDAADALSVHRPVNWSETTDLTRARMRIALACHEPVEAQRMALEAASRTGDVLTRRATLLHEALRAGAPPAQVAAALAQVAASSDLVLVSTCAEHAAAAMAGDGKRLIAVADRFERIGALLHAAEAAAQAAAAHAAAAEGAQAISCAQRSRSLAARCEGAWTPLLGLADAAAHQLTAREAQVAALAASGLTNGQIAERLVLSVRTIDSHMQRIYGKLSINRRDRIADVLALDVPTGELPPIQPEVTDDLRHRTS